MPAFDVVNDWHSIALAAAAGQAEANGSPTKLAVLADAHQAHTMRLVADALAAHGIAADLDPTTALSLARAIRQIR
jgi:hypothetical protein